MHSNLLVLTTRNYNLTFKLDPKPNLSLNFQTGWILFRVEMIPFRLLPVIARSRNDKIEKALFWYLQAVCQSTIFTRGEKEECCISTGAELGNTGPSISTFDDIRAHVGGRKEKVGSSSSLGAKRKPEQAWISRLSRRRENALGRK